MCSWSWGNSFSNVPAVERELVAAIQGRAERVVLDLSGCEFLDSSALAMLVRARRLLRPSQRFALVVPYRIVLKTFETTRLDRMFEIHATRDAALEQGGGVDVFAKQGAGITRG